MEWDSVMLIVSAQIMRVSNVHQNKQEWFKLRIRCKAVMVDNFRGSCCRAFITVVFGSFTKHTTNLLVYFYFLSAKECVFIACNNLYNEKVHFSLNINKIQSSVC